MEWMLLAGVAAVVAIFAFLILRYGEAKRKEGAAEVLNDVLKQEQKDAKKAADVMAEHRDDGDTSERLRRGDF